jgi:hypothetical protein
VLSGEQVRRYSFVEGIVAPETGNPWHSFVVLMNFKVLEIKQIIK